jgi:hypothetical protein
MTGNGGAAILIGADGHHLNGRRRARMYKLITILAAAIPVILFLKTVFFGRSKVMREASSAFKRQVDYLVWGIVVLVTCALVYSVGSLIYPMLK